MKGGIGQGLLGYGGESLFWLVSPGCGSFVVTYGVPRCVPFRSQCALAFHRLQLCVEWSGARAGPYTVLDHAAHLLLCRLTVAN